LVVVWLAVPAYLPTGHGLRVFCTVLSAGAGLIAAVGLSRSQTWSARLTCAAAGLAVASSAWLFVPASDGPSLWQARRCVAELEALPAGDVSGFTKGKPSRRDVAVLFPVLRNRVEQAEMAWLGRTVDEVVSHSDDLLDDDPAQATAMLRGAVQELGRLDHFDKVQDRLMAARRRALMKRLELARREGPGNVPVELRDEAKAVDMEGFLQN
jgi:hypothetical protein